jgi:hypothetical protein
MAVRGSNQSPSSRYPWVASRSTAGLALKLQMEGIRPQLPAGLDLAARHLRDLAPLTMTPRDGLVVRQWSAEVFVQTVISR